MSLASLAFHVSNASPSNLPRLPAVPSCPPPVRPLVESSVVSKPRFLTLSLERSVWFLMWTSLFSVSCFSASATDAVRMRALIASSAPTSLLLREAELPRDEAPSRGVVVADLRPRLCASSRDSDVSPMLVSSSRFAKFFDMSCNVSQCVTVSPSYCQ